ncbi:Na+/H+ antiporter NhaA [Psychrosphaera aestuarii]|uniref:Na+/H+ antiporter NhaA n=1 Tax=Psychrosphaera aestuarii TaxID=1266052 RepID=UPI003CC7EEDC
MQFFKTESAGGILLFLAAILAIICANTALVSYYEMLLSTPVEIRIGALEIAKPLLLWINDGLMAVFFFLVGLELKRELIEGELSDKRNIILPGVGAIGGMLVPALVYVYFNADNEAALSGWAIPAATDIAFALGVLTLLGSRVPVALKVFLTSLAIFDDIGAILIIAFFYTSKISITALIVVALCIPVLTYLNKRNVVSYSPYIFIGIIMWIATLKSGVHATLAGVLLAMFIPMRSKENPSFSPVKELEHDLHSVVAFFVLPVFAFANAGLNLTGVGVEQLLHPVPVGIAAGLFIGKQVGIFGLCWLAVKAGLAQLPKGMNWASLYGTAALCGIGFTMSLFIGSLAFEETGVDLLFDERLGIIVGSILSGVVGYLVLNKSLKKVP